MLKDPRKIEDRSFEIIDRHLRDIKLPKFQKEVIKRVIHATANFSYAKRLLFSPQAVKAGLEAIRKGKNIIVDATMVKAGINKKILSNFKGKIICFINDKDVILQSAQLNTTRAILAMRKSKGLMNGGMVAIGNAPTALFELCDLVRKGEARPALIVGVPVGFVGAVESKIILSTLKIPFITNQTRYGGSSVACAIINALLQLAREGVRRRQLNIRRKGECRSGKR